MKRVLFFVLVLTLAAGAVFGDDAKTMPKMVGRLWLAPTFVFAPGEYDTDGNYKGYGSGDGAVKMLNLGFALEYGVIDWITAAIQWAPGVTVWSDMDGKVPISMTAMSDSSVNLNGVADLFVGAKVQIAGEKAPLKTDRLRLAIGPGVKIPLPGQDFEDQLANANKKDTVTALNLDKHVFGFGARVYFDYIFNEHFFINFYNETLFYPVKGAIDKASYGEYLIFAGAKQQTSSPNADADVGYGYDLTFELEPVFSTSLGSGITFTAGLPLNYKFTPAHTYSVSGAAANQLIEDALDDAAYPSHMFKVKPNIGFFFTNWFLPTDISLTYGIPVWGKGDNVKAQHEITLKVKLYFALPGAR